MEPKISIIVPVYKTENFLGRCIESIIRQNFTDFELLLINDGSPDNSGKICEEYAQKDSRIRVFHKENGGVSTARNLGIVNAIGEYLTFVDSDDYVSLDYLSRFLSSGANADMYIQGYQLVDTIKKRVKCCKFEKSQFFRNIAEPFLLAEKNGVITSPYVKLFKRKIVIDNNLKFDIRLKNGEDLVFVLTYLCFVQTVFVSDFAGYFYVNHGGESLSKRFISFDEMQSQMFRVYGLRNQIIRKHRIQNSACLDWVNYSFANTYILSILALYNPKSLLSRKDRIFKLQKCMVFIRENPIIGRVRQKTFFLKLWRVAVLSHMPFKDFYLGLIGKALFFFKRNNWRAFFQRGFVFCIVCLLSYVFIRFKKKV